PRRHPAGRKPAAASDRAGSHSSASRTKRRRRDSDRRTNIEARLARRAPGPGLCHRRVASGGDWRAGDAAVTLASSIVREEETRDGAQEGRATASRRYRTRPDSREVAGGEAAAPHTRSAHRLSRRYHTSLSPNPGYAAFRPLGFGTTKTAASPMRSGFS